MINTLTTEEIDTESSKLLIKAEYNPLYHTLTLHFKTNGSIYEYKGVSEETWEEFKTSPSKGKYFHAFIKKTFLFEKLS